MSARRGRGAIYSQMAMPELANKSLRNHSDCPQPHLKVLEMASPRAYYDFSFQTVSYSDNGRLVERFLQLPIAQHFAYGSANRGLTYLPLLRQSKCRLTVDPKAFTLFRPSEHPHSVATFFTRFISATRIRKRDRSVPMVV